LVSYLTCNYLLYLHVSGQFHIACGLMHMFGYGLPETHHHYLLATGFTDYWRRINIYWKDFMVRIVFNPIAFRLKRRPQWQALAAATVAVFFATWFLHAYQSYWLRGTWGFTWPDALFWGILGILVLVNVQLDARAPRKKASNEAHTCRELAVRSIKIAGTFTTIAVLWSLWSSPTVSEWLAMMGRGLSLGS
jgi:D-alanyl-lipoteichoic acid acyltransferase DltB (MBOAT superfamily)